MTSFLLYIIFVYLIGGLCGAYYLLRWKTGENLRDHGSGNLGATNAGRVLGKAGFIITFLWDAGKGSAIIYGARILDYDQPLIWICAIALVAGHIWPIQLQFKGGKGAATLIGILVVLDAYLLWPLLIIFLTSFVILRKFGIAGALAFFTLPFVVWLRGYEPLSVILSIILTLIVIFAYCDHIVTFVSAFKKRSRNK